MSIYALFVVRFAWCANPNWLLHVIHLLCFVGVVFLTLIVRTIAVRFFCFFSATYSDFFSLAFGGSEVLGIAQRLLALTLPFPCGLDLT
jgi:hypothetical protein